MSEIPDFSLTRSEAVALLLEKWMFLHKTEYVPVAESFGRVTASAVYSQNTLPQSRVSAADGIAVRSTDFEDGTPDTSTWIRNVNFAQADTGDDFPDEFDTVIPVEEIYFDENGKLCFTEEFEYVKNSCVRPAGSMIQSGNRIAGANTYITPVLMSALALGGAYQVEVLRRPKVVFIPTGDELIPVGQMPVRGQHIETNSLMVSAYLKEWGADAVCFPIVKDDVGLLKAALETAIAIADIVLINGGSSKGTEDFNAKLLKSCAEFFYHGMKCIPGRPVAVSLIGGTPVINLPGPPLATFLALDWCVRAVVYHWYGIPLPKRQAIKARLEAPIRKPVDSEFVVRCAISRRSNGYTAAPVGHGVSQLDSMIVPNALFTAPIGTSEYAPGDEIDVELLCGVENIRYVEVERRRA